MLKLSISQSGIPESLNVLKKFSELENVVGEGVEESAHQIRDRINARVPEYGNKCDVYMISKLEAVVGPSIQTIEQILSIPSWQKYETTKRCVWRRYKRFISAEQRIPLPLASLTNDQVRNIVRDMIPTVKEIIKNQIIELLRR